MSKTTHILLPALLACLSSFGIVDVAIAGMDFEAIEMIHSKPTQIANIHRYAITLTSSREFQPELHKKQISRMTAVLGYSARVNIDGKTWYRLVVGNFKTSAEAENYRQPLLKQFPGAWVMRRTDDESGMLRSALKQSPARGKLKGISSLVNGKPKPSVSRSIEQSKAIQANEKLAETLLSDARDQFLDHNYGRVISITDKVIEIGTPLQQQRAIELSGIVRERQQQFAQAIAIYRDFLNRFPDSELRPSIESRLVGLQTMRSTPKTLMQKTVARETDAWSTSGFLSQDYRNDEINIDSLESETVGNALTTYIDLFARKKTPEEVVILRFDGGIENDFLNDENEPQISQALVDYTDEIGGHQLIGGRQNRTAKGVLGRFDGLVYRYLKPDSIDYSVYTGYPVQHSYDGLQTEQQFIGGSVNLDYWEDVGVDLYLISQKVGGLTDRQAVGSEVLYQYDSGFVLGQIDYDLFFNELNSLTTIANYRHDAKWSYNLTVDHRNSPLLTTTNAIQGQGVETVSELEDIFSDSEIYQLAEDRTSMGDYLLFGINHQLDNDRSIYVNLSYSQIDATSASGGVESIPSSVYRYFSVDYYTRNFFIENDTTSFSTRLSVTDTTDTLSFRGISRLPAVTREFHYDPSLRIDFRNSKRDGSNQFVLYPSVKAVYKPSRELSFEAGLGIEYTEYDQPDNGNQLYTNFYFGYFYQF